ncbi:serine/threonine-protein kinase [Streptomyces sp. NPDC048506]|uniref:serine/threonine-protein kinase n=1 Tax=Streptomyces sp. NPDC048506 TaxID=3155028 RepID=UPI003417606F
MAERDQLLGGRYRLVRQLGEGGMGQVWEAQDETLSRPVAVKVISLLAGRGSRGDEARARFLREARITARLQHPNIVTIHDLGETDSTDDRVPFLVMELVRGEGLDVLLRRGGITLADAARWGAQICDALADAHDTGIMHRDIKPSNILITPSGIVKVLDFGVARAADPYATADRLTQTGFIVGTPPYMAPEQARGFPEPRSDLYALGCLLFELITGQLPFQAPDTVGYLSAHLTQEPPTPSSVSTSIPSAWDDLVLTLLHKDPTQRYPNAAALSQALRQLDGAPEPLAPSDEHFIPPATMPSTPPPPPAESVPGKNRAPGTNSAAGTNWVRPPDAAPANIPAHLEPATSGPLDNAPDEHLTTDQTHKDLSVGGGEAALSPTKTMRRFLPPRKAVIVIPALLLITSTIVASGIMYSLRQKEDHNPTQRRESPTPSATVGFKTIPDICGNLSEAAILDDLIDYRRPSDSKTSTNERKCGWETERSATVPVDASLTLTARKFNSTSQAESYVAKEKGQRSIFGGSAYTDLGKPGETGDQAIFRVWKEIVDKTGGGEVYHSSNTTEITFRKSNLVVEVEYTRSRGNDPKPADTTTTRRGAEAITEKAASSLGG